MSTPERSLPPMLAMGGGLTRTNVRVVTGPFLGALMCFRVAAAATRRRSLATEAEGAWRGLGFRGAALLFPWKPPATSEARAQCRLELLCASDPLLCVNVLGRARGILFLASSPLSLHSEHLGRELWTSDARLVALARSSGVEGVIP